MKIEGKEGPASPPFTLSTTLSNASNSSTGTDEMIENENQTMRDRVGDLEKKVLDQNDEIMCLRSTLADALRRISSLEGSKNTVDRSSCSPSSASLVKEGMSAFRLRGVPSEGAREHSKRASSYIPGRSANSTPSSARGGRRAPQYQSTSSLYSDGHSSSSASPAPSPSPTSHHHNNGNAGNGGNTGNTGGNTGGQHLRPHSHPHHPHHQAPSSAFASPVHTGLRTQHPNPALNKRWASTSDFGAPANGGVSPGGHDRHAGGAANGTAGNHKRLITGSLHNLSNLRSNSSFNLSRPGKDASVQYNADEGVVKLYLRGRPLNLFVPTQLRDTFHTHKHAQSPHPGAKLKLEWVYGYRGRDCRCNVYQLPTGEIVYFVASVVVLYNAEEQSQRHYLGHTDDIKCLAIHPNKLTIATGQTAGHDRKDARSWRLNPPPDPFSPEAEEWPHIRIWDSVSLATLQVIGIGDVEKAVACLAFSKADGGGLLVIVDEAPDHNMSVWDWSKGDRGYKLMETKCAADQVLSVEFSPVDRNTIITCGKNQISFWVYESGMLAKRVGIFETRERPKYVTAISFTDSGNVISGDTNGNILVWQRGGNRVERSVKNAHDGAIFSILVQKDGTIITGGKDGKILEWSRDLRKTGNQMQVPEAFGSPRVVTSGKGTRLVVGTTKNCVLGGTFALPLQPLMQGHTEELFALAPHPSQNQFLTAGYDKACYLWDTMAKAIVWKKVLQEPAQCAAFSRNGEMVLIGTSTGRWLALDAQTRETVVAHQDGGEPIQVMQFSPTGQMLALGSRDNNIYMYQVSEGARKYARMGRCQGHSCYVTHLDWSADGQFLRSNSGDYDLLYWNASTCRQIPQAAQMRDVEWATHFCPLAFASLGVWLDGGGGSEGGGAAGGSDVLCCAKASGYDLLVTGDDLGKVKIFSYPASHLKARSVESTGGHSSPVTSVRFLHNDTRLLSIGGRDAAVMQWMIANTNAAGR